MKKALFICTSVFMLTLMGCIEDPALVSQEDDEIVQSPNIQIRINGKVGAQPFVLNDTFRIDGYNLKVSLLQYYLCDLTFTQEDGKTVQVLMRDEDGVYGVRDNALLVNMSNGHGPEGRGYEQIDLIIPEGVYRSMSFGVGLSMPFNWSDFTQYTTDEDLGAQGMYWGWAAGYRFVKLEGKYDTSRFSSANIIEPFVYHTGTDSLFRTVKFDNDFYTVLDETVKVYEIDLDIAEVFHGPRPMDLPNEDFSHTLGSAISFTIAEKLTDNLKSAFQRP